LSADISAEQVMVNMDITDIQYSADSFDAVICNHVLEHIPNDRVAMKELHRVLRPDGWALLQVPISLNSETTYEDASITTPDGRERAFGQADHVRIYARDYVDRLRGAGFGVEVFDWRTQRGHFGGSENRFGLNGDERVFLAHKER